MHSIGYTAGAVGQFCFQPVSDHLIGGEGRIKIFFFWVIGCGAMGSKYETCEFCLIMT